MTRQFRPDAAGLMIEREPYYQPLRGEVALF